MQFSCQSNVSPFAAENLAHQKGKCNKTYLKIIFSKKNTSVGDQKRN